MSGKLIVAGCSFSDCFYEHKEGKEVVTKAYGHYLSEKIGCEYLHRAATCSSNFRIWRDIPALIMHGAITENDLLLIQYTELSRREFAYFDQLDSPASVNEKFTIFDSDASLVRFKINSHSWHKNKRVSEFLKYYEEDFMVPEYDLHLFEIQNLMFQTFLAHHNINAYFLLLNSYGPNEESIFKNNLFKDKYYKDRDIGVQTEHQYNRCDQFHLSNLGHQALAIDLFQFLQERNEIQRLT